jgi:hypothetical protein
MSTRASANGAGSRPGPRLREPSFSATRCEATLSGAIEWIISVQPSVSNAQSAAAADPSTA